MMLSQLNSLHPRVEQIRRDGFGMWNERNHDFFNAKICVANGMERKQENTSTVVALTPEDYVTNICTQIQMQVESFQKPDRLLGLNKKAEKQKRVCIRRTLLMKKKYVLCVRLPVSIKGMDLSISPLNEVSLCNATGSH